MIETPAILPDWVFLNWDQSLINYEINSSIICAAHLDDLTFHWIHWQSFSCREPNYGWYSTMLRYPRVSIPCWSPLGPPFLTYLGSSLHIRPVIRVISPNISSRVTVAEPGNNIMLLLSIAKFIDLRAWVIFRFSFCAFLTFYKNTIGVWKLRSHNAVN